jgi:hypothetical protein
MSHKSRKRVPLSCLGPKAINQLREMGIDVNKASIIQNVKITSAIPFHKFKVSAAELRTFDGIKFDSKLEMNLYKKLKELRIPFERQPEFIIQEGFEHGDKKIRPIKYVGDFKLKTRAGKSLVVDAKGFRTPEHMIKAKMMLRVHGIEVIYIKSLSALMNFLFQHGFLNRSTVS